MRYGNVWFLRGVSDRGRHRVQPIARAEGNAINENSKFQNALRTIGIWNFSIGISKSYLAIFTALVSRITVTFTWPG